MVDAREGITAVDEDVARVLRRTGKPVFIAANKVDTPSTGTPPPPRRSRSASIGCSRSPPPTAAAWASLLDAVIEVLGDRVTLAAPAATAAD